MMTEETTYITSHVVARAQDKRLEFVEVTHEGITALPVFRNEEDTIRYMADSSHNPYDGFRIIPMDHETIAGVLAIMGVGHVALSEAWTSSGGVDVFTGENFVQMLEDSLRED